ncbi:MAG: helix-turn-helix transcriptional regulator, partial [Lachnospiraceae bacterium]|nr:helix-turn-helix transcriptional regulator [Lachnospiraceae bacterium]
PILRRLEAGEYLTVKSMEHNGRLRKYYRITQSGLERIEAFREEWKEIMEIYRFVVREESEHE